MKIKQLKEGFLLIHQNEQLEIHEPDHIYEFADLKIVLLEKENIFLPYVGRYYQLMGVDLLLVSDELNEQEKFYGPWSIAQNCLVYCFNQKMLYAPLALCPDETGRMSGDAFELSHEKLKLADHEFGITDNLNYEWYVKEYPHA